MKAGLMNEQPATGRFLKRNEWAVLVFTLLYILVAIIASVRRNNTEFILYIGVMFVLLAAVGIIHFRIRLHVAALWGLSIWGLAHMAGGLLPIPDSWPRLGETSVLYNLWIIPGWLKFDQRQCHGEKMSGGVIIIRIFRML